MKHITVFKQKFAKLQRTTSRFTLQSLVFCIAILMMPALAHAQLPAGVVLTNPQLNTQTTAQIATPPIGWTLDLGGTVDVENMDNLRCNGSVGCATWTTLPSSQFPASVTNMISGGQDLANPPVQVGSESFSQHISGLVTGQSYTYSILAAGNCLSGLPCNATSLTIGLYFNDVLLSSNAVTIGTTATTKSFTFTAPAASGTIKFGFVSSVGGTPNGNPLYEIGAGTGFLSTVVVCNAGTAQVPLNGSTITNSCPAATVNLTNLATGTAPSGSSLVFFTTANHTGTAVANPSAAPATGTYYAFYFDSVNNCYNTASSTAVITATTTVCCNANAGTISRQ